MNSSGSGKIRVTRCEHGNDTSGSKKGGQFLV